MARTVQTITAPALNTFLTLQARSAVVRLKDPGTGRQGLFSGFFISPDGYLITAFHAVKTQLLEQGHEFEVDLEQDNTVLTTTQGRTSSLRVAARSEPNWSDPRADWALLKLDYRPGAFLPLAPGPDNRDDPDDLCSQLRVYGFTITQGMPNLGALSGEYVRAGRDRGRFHIAYSIRSRGQSGGPVIDMRTQHVVGTAVGYRKGEQLTGEAAIIDQARLARLELGVDFHELSVKWRRSAAEYVCRNERAFAPLLSGSFVPSLPEKLLRGRSDVRYCHELLRSGSRTDLFLHGPSGSGKSMLALEVVQQLHQNGVVDSIFWYDFEPERHRSLDHLIRRLALHLLEHQGALDTLDECLDESFQQDRTQATLSLLAELSLGRHAFVFDNVHFPQREGDTQVLGLLDDMVRAVRGRESVLLFTSWDAPRTPLSSDTHRVHGLTEDEVAKFLRLYRVEVSGPALERVCRFSEDITCVESFIRSAEWRTAVESGRDLTTEPDALQRYWQDRFLAHLSTAERRVLLALAVLQEPASRPAVEELADVRGFANALSRLRTSPPLVQENDNRYWIHHNVARAALSTSDRADVRNTHESAARYFRTTANYALAAGHYLDAGNAEEALRLLYERRDTIISSGQLTELHRLTDRLVRATGTGSSTFYQFHAIIASCENVRGNYSAADQHWELSLAGSSDALETAALHNRRGDSFRLTSDYSAARQEYNTAQRLLEASRDAAYRTEFGRANVGLAKLDRLRAAYASALHGYRAAHEAFALVYDESGLIETDFGAGEVFRLQQRWSEATDAYQKSLARARNQKNVEREAYTLWGLGEVQRLTNHFAQAIETHREGLDLCTKTGDTRSEGWALMGLAESWRMSGRADESLAAYQQALSKFRITRSSTEIAHALLGLAETQRTLGRPEPDRYDEIRRTYEAKGMRHCLVMCCLAHAAAQRSGGPSSRDRELVEQARQIAGECALTDELSLAETMLDDPAHQPLWSLNFP